jgi:hypothetical protein
MTLANLIQTSNLLTPLLNLLNFVKHLLKVHLQLQPSPLTQPQEPRARALQPVLPDKQVDGCLARGLGQADAVGRGQVEGFGGADRVDFFVEGVCGVEDCGDEGAEVGYFGGGPGCCGLGEGV